MMTKEIKIKLLELGKRQLDLMWELNKRGFPNVTQTSISKVINRNRVWETAGGDRIRAAIEEILDEWEQEQSDKREIS